MFLRMISLFFDAAHESTHHFHYTGLTKNDLIKGALQHLYHKYILDSLRT